ncbi:MAG: cation:proton antiporter [Phycisphaerales bacterium]
MKVTFRQFVTWALLVLAMIALRAGGPLLTPERDMMVDALGESYAAPDTDLLQTATALAFLLLGSWLTGRIFGQFSLPKITGYLAFGVLVGPYLTPLLTTEWPPLVSLEQIGYLRLVSALAIALIGLIAGGEIRIDLLREDLRRVLTITFVEMAAVSLAVFSVLFVFRSRIALLAELPNIETFVVCGMIAVVAIANSPAVVVAMIIETGAKGVIAQTSLAITVCKDLCLVVLVTIAMAIGVGMLATGEANEPSSSLVGDLAWHLLGSIVAGGIVGVAMAMILGRMGRRMPVFVIVTAISIALVSEAAHLEPLLVALTAGFTLANLWPEHSEPLFHTIEELSLPVYCVFFALAGARINLEVVWELWPAALLVVGVRLVAVWGSTTFAAKLSGIELPARRWLWTSLVPQAGVAIALTVTVSNSFGEYEWGQALASLLLAIIAMHEVFGPVLMRFGLTRAGETAG